MNDLCADAPFDQIYEALPDHAKEYLWPTYFGDVDAAVGLVVATPNSLRGIIARSFYEERLSPYAQDLDPTGAPLAAFRAYLGGAWDHDHAYVIGAAGTVLKAMFQTAQFPIPELPEEVTIWRGGKNTTVDELASGLSWTLDRRVASWFAVRTGPVSKSRHHTNPLVIKTTVPRSALIYYSNDRNEAEVIPERLASVTVDGDASTWVREFEEMVALRKAAAPA